jgi:thiosulfate reductase/polysulfide reductase chain A
MKTRREFLKISTLGLGGIALTAAAGNFIKDPKAMDRLFRDSGGGDSPLRTPTYCEICFWKCAGWVYKNDKGEIQKLIGNDEDSQCNGRLCPRGTGGVGMYHDEDRLRTPLIRTSGKGGQQFREASWDEALDLIAKKFESIKNQYGPESIALFTHGSGTEYLETLLKAYGSDNIAEPAYAQCKGPREAGFLATFGAGLGSPEPTDIRDTRCLVLIGSHIGENMHNAQVQEMSDAIDKGATIITVDPRFSTAASKSKFSLPIKPATDMALLLSWMHVLIHEGGYNKAYVEKYANGFEQLKAHVLPYTPEWAFGITTIAPDIIRKTAREMANASPAVIVHPGRHVTWYGDDTQRARAVAILNALLGSYGKRGGFYFPARASLKKEPLPPFPEPKWTWRNVVNYPFADVGVTNAIVDATLIDKPGAPSVKAWMVNGSNLPFTMPDTKRTLKAIQKLDFLVVIDTMPMEITGWADVVLPECTYLERYDKLRTVPDRIPQVALRMPAVAPKYETKPDYWIATQLARRMGVEAWFPYQTMEQRLEEDLHSIGSSLAEMKKTGIKTMTRSEDDPLYIPDGADFEFGTESGKIELYSGDFEAAGFAPLPVYTQHPEPPEGFYRLIYGRAPMHTFSRTSNNPNLFDLKKETSLWVNPKVATKWGLKNDQQIFLENQDGVVASFPIKVRITERIRWDSVYLYHGFGHTDKRLSRAFGGGTSDAELITSVSVDPLCGGTGMRGNFVTFKTDREA